MKDRQLDLFAAPDDPRGDDRIVRTEPPPAAFVEGIRRELLATLERARAAEYLPWPNLTAATLGEMRFKSIAGWLPQAEADRLRDEFETELVRLYANEDARFERENPGSASA